MAAMGAAPAHVDSGQDEHPPLFELGFRQFLRDMVAGLREDLRTIMNIRTMRYALVGVAALLFTITAIAAWLPQYYERHLHFEEGVGEGMFGLLAVFGGVPGVLVGALCFTGSYLFRSPGGATDVDWSVAGPAFALQLAGLFIVPMSIAGLRAGLTDAIPAHLRGAGFGAFNLVSVVFGMAAAPFIVGALSSAFDENLRVAFLLVTPFSLIGPAILYRARKFLDEDVQRIMMAVLVALQEAQQRAQERAAEQGIQPS